MTFFAKKIFQKTSLSKKTNQKPKITTAKKYQEKYYYIYAYRIEKQGKDFLSL